MACAAKGTMPRSGPLVDGRRAGDGERGDRERVFGVVLLSKKFFQTSPGASQFGFQVHWGLTFLFPLFTQLRYEKNMRVVGLTGHSICLIPVGWGYSWRIVRKVRTDQTSRGSGCRGGLGGKLHHICMVRANRFPSFSSFPPDSIPPPEFWIIFFVFIPYHPKLFQFFQVPPVVRSIGLVKRKFHKVIGGMRCGPARRWVQENLEVRKTSCKRWLRFFNGKRILRDTLSEKFKEWNVDMFPEALVLRSLRPVPGYWRLPVWEQAEDINSECFSCLRSWSFRTRIPQRIHNQLFGTMCGIFGVYSSSQGAACAVGRVGSAAESSRA